MIDGYLAPDLVQQWTSIAPQAVRIHFGTRKATITVAMREPLRDLRP
jgi:hypothetical protein